MGAETNRVGEVGVGAAIVTAMATITTTKRRVSVLGVLITSFRVRDKKSKLWYVTVTPLLFPFSLFMVVEIPYYAQPPNTMNGLYAEPASATRSTPVLQSHRSHKGPYFSGSAPPPPQQPSRPQKRPFFQRIFHPFGSGGASDPLSASRRGSRR